jgi:hypothetical protein
MDNACSQITGIFYNKKGNGTFNGLKNRHVQRMKQPKRLIIKTTFVNILN